MELSKLKKVATPKAMGAYLKKNAPKRGPAHAMHHPTTRTVDYNGHTISIETTYRVEIDGTRVKLPLMVDESGNVHCHSLPNYQFQSALDMVKATIDSFPDEFQPAKKGKKVKSGKKGRTQGHTTHHKHAKSARRRATAARKKR